MPGGSFNEYNDVRVAVIRALTEPTDAILDVGPGHGKYSKLLREFRPNMDAVEIFPRYIDDYGLKERYRNIRVGDVRLLTPTDFGPYRLVICGDVLEHMTVSAARGVLDRILAAGCIVFVQLPFKYLQDAVDGNEHERHIQDDLTPALVRQRYPMLKPVIENTKIKAKQGLYVGGPRDP